MTFRAIEELSGPWILRTRSIAILVHGGTIDCELCASWESIVLAFVLLVLCASAKADEQFTEIV